MPKKHFLVATALVAVLVIVAGCAAAAPGREQRSAYIRDV